MNQKHSCYSLHFFSRTKILVIILNYTNSIYCIGLKISKAYLDTCCNGSGNGIRP